MTAINAYTEKTLTESMLSKEYADNGVVVKTKEDATALLKSKGFKKLQSIYRNKLGKTAIVYALRDAVLDTQWPHKVVRFVPKGFLVSFGGEPKSCYSLKFSQIKRPAF